MSLIVAAPLASDIVWVFFVLFFWLQCKPEYKVPGLYVIDSIVRQSRHQFGTEKDVFAPRFSKNIILTFQHLYRCPSDDKVRTFLRAFPSQRLDVER